MEKKMLSVLAIGIVALLGIGLVAAYQGDYSVQGPNYSEDRHELMEDSFDNLDYNAWVNLMTEDGRHPRVLDIVTEENFAIFAEAHEAGKSGDFAKASELRAELGLGNHLQDGTGPGKGSGQRSMRGSGMQGQKRVNCQFE